MSGDVTIVRIERALGASLTEKQRAEVLEAGAHELVVELAEKFGSNPNIDSPTGAFLNALRRGAHRRADKPKRDRAEPVAASALQRAHALFTGKLRDLAHTSWDERERIEFAIDYALDWCGDSSCEPQLRAELGVPAWHPNDGTPMPGDPAKDTEHRRLMRQVHGPQPHAPAQLPATAPPGFALPEKRPR